MCGRKPGDCVDPGLTHNGSTMTREEAVAAITGRLVEYYHPERIYLFGSEARGDAAPDSDLDFCVVVPDDAPVALLRDGGIYSLLRGMGYPKDIVPWRRRDRKSTRLNSSH